AFEVGEILFVSLDATKVGYLPDEQKTWLKQLLTEHGQRYKRHVVFGHVPLRTFAIGRERDILGDHELETLLQQANVDIFLNGHHHAYYPGYKDGIRYISQACLGAGPRNLLGTDQRSKRSITVIEFEADGSYLIEAYQSPDFTRPVDIGTLPERIQTKWAVVIRNDLASE
ncbi:MAG: metallophosphoesterase, partial [Pseudomonadota bacterium]|nr:metallophosphoesterase [Pseudomonadota bacterium]